MSAIQALSLPLRAALLAAIPLLFGPARAAEPAPDMSRVEVYGQTREAPAIGRTDVRASCPGVDASLQRSLARVWFLEQQAGVMRVDFQLEGSAVGNVQASGPLRSYYGQAVRRAVRQLSCGNSGAGAAGPQRYTMLISFADDSADDQQGQNVALLQRP